MGLPSPLCYDYMCMYVKSMAAMVLLQSGVDATVYSQGCLLLHGADVYLLICHKCYCTCVHTLYSVCMLPNLQMYKGHCSGLIKVLPGYENIYAAHSRYVNVTYFTVTI